MPITYLGLQTLKTWTSLVLLPKHQMQAVKTRKQQGQHTDAHALHTVLTFSRSEHFVNQQVPWFSYQPLCRRNSAAFGCAASKLNKQKVRRQLILTAPSSKWHVSCRVIFLQLLVDTSDKTLKYLTDTNKPATHIMEVCPYIQRNKHHKYRAILKN